jgi:hypothetical protein
MGKSFDEDKCFQAMAFKGFLRTKKALGIVKICVKFDNFWTKLTLL